VPPFWNDFLNATGIPNVLPDEKCLELATLVGFENPGCGVSNALDTAQHGQLRTRTRESLLDTGWSLAVERRQEEKLGGLVDDHQQNSFAMDGGGPRSAKVSQQALARNLRSGVLRVSPAVVRWKS
jgi:hypothetical protein